MKASDISFLNIILQHSHQLFVEIYLSESHEQRAIHTCMTTR
jgi:hypothetical protein